MTIAAAAGGELPAVMQILRDDSALCFEQLIDIAGMDYSAYSGRTAGARFAAVYHFLSLRHNRRLRLRAFCADDDFPALQSVTDLWPAANWFEREAFDLFGIVFHGHPDLRRILTRLRICRTSVSQRFSGFRACRNALRCRKKTRGVCPGEHSAARGDAADNARRIVRPRARQWLKSATIR